VRHEVADVTAVLWGNPLTQPPVLPGVSYRSVRSEVRSLRDNVASALGLAA
jgi:hypothetical protein